MNVNPLSSTGRGADIPIEELASNSKLSEKEKLKEASRQFEAALLRQILADARKPVFPSRFTQQSAANGIYDDLITNQLADSISRGGQFGLARDLQSQLASTVTHLDSDKPKPS